MIVLNIGVFVLCLAIAWSTGFCAGRHNKKK